MQTAEGATSALFLFLDMFRKVSQQLRRTLKSADVAAPEAFRRRHMPDPSHLLAVMKPYRKGESLLKRLSEREWKGSSPSLFSAARLQHGAAMGFWPAVYRALGKPSEGSQSPPQRLFA
jgi:hypothetical protein